MPNLSVTHLGHGQAPAACASKWISALETLILEIPEDQRMQITSICCSGTSASCLVVDVGREDRCTVTRLPRMYDYNVVSQLPSYGQRAIDTIARYAPPDSPALAPTSTLPKLIAWNLEKRLENDEKLVHQADLIAGHLMHDMIFSSKTNQMSHLFTSDWNNALKLGFDVQNLQYPVWMSELLAQEGMDLSILPSVVEPGFNVGTVCDSVAKRLELPKNIKVMAGTTDSIAAFLASGASKSGQAVSSLGSTLAIKMLSDIAVEDSNRGIYSHRLGNQWLVGGASNVGCAVLRQEGFSNEELVNLSKDIDPSVDSKLEYYPLTKKGERFPENDPNKEPVLSPVPESRREYLHGILQGITMCEKKGYSALVDLGSTKPTEIFTAGGGSKNTMWTRMRERIIGVKTSQAANIDAAYGAALLGCRL